MFLLLPPPERFVRQMVESLVGRGFSYPEVGMTSRSAPPGYRVRRAACTLGWGAEVFGRAQQAIREWRMFDLGWIRVLPADLPVAVGSTVGVLVRHFGFWSLNFSRIVYVINEARRYGFAYGTLEEHAEMGEELFAAEWKEDDSVRYEILALSRERHWLARVAWPLARTLQRKFRRDSTARMRDAVSVNRCV